VGPHSLPYGTDSGTGQVPPSMYLLVGRSPV